MSYVIQQTPVFQGSGGGIGGRFSLALEADVNVLTLAQASLPSQSPFRNDDSTCMFFF